MPSRLCRLCSYDSCRQDQHILHKMDFGQILHCFLLRELEQLHQSEFWTHPLIHYYYFQFAIHKVINLRHYTKDIVGIMYCPKNVNKSKYLFNSLCTSRAHLNQPHEMHRAMLFKPYLRSSNACRTVVGCFSGPQEQYICQ